MAFFARERRGQLEMKLTKFYRDLAILVLRAGLIVVLLGAGWLVYKRLPAGVADDPKSATTSLQIVLRQGTDSSKSALDVTVEFYPVDIVAVRHEFFADPRAGKSFEDFRKERMNGKVPVSASLDKQGHGIVVLTPGSWWLYARLSGDEELEWRLPISVAGAKQTIELTPQNAYTRSKTF